MSEASTPRLKLRLYVADSSAQSRNAMATLDTLKQRGFDIEIEVIDIVGDPQRAETDKVIATPMLAKLAPPPVRRVVGDLSDVQQVINSLQIG